MLVSESKVESIIFESKNNNWKEVDEYNYGNLILSGVYLALRSYFSTRKSFFIHFWIFEKKQGIL